MGLCGEVCIVYGEFVDKDGQCRKSIRTMWSIQLRWWHGA